MKIETNVNDMAVANLPYIERYFANEFSGIINQLAKDHTDIKVDVEGEDPVCEYGSETWDADYTITITATRKTPLNTYADAFDPCIKIEAVCCVFDINMVACMADIELDEDHCLPELTDEQDAAFDEAVSELKDGPSDEYEMVFTGIKSITFAHDEIWNELKVFEPEYAFCTNGIVLDEATDYCQDEYAGDINAAYELECEENAEYEEAEREAAKLG